MKKIISILMAALVLMSSFAVNSFAATTHKATWTLKASVYNAASSESADKTNFTKGGSTVYNSASTSNINVKPGQVVWVTIHLKTDASYYAAEMENMVFYSNNIFTSSKSGNFVWNTSGKYTKLCARQANVFAKMSDKYKSSHYPDKWTAAQKSANEFYTIIMYPSGTSTVANIDEDIVSFPIYVKSNAKAGTKGSVYISQDDLATASNPNGCFCLNYYEKGDMSKASVQNSKNVTHDTSKAKINFTVVSGGSTPTPTPTPTPGGNTDPTPTQGDTFDISAILTAIGNFFKMIIDFFSSIIQLFTK